MTDAQDVHKLANKKCGKRRARARCPMHRRDARHVTRGAARGVGSSIVGGARDARAMPAVAACLMRSGNGRRINGLSVGCSAYPQACQQNLWKRRRRSGGAKKGGGGGGRLPPARRCGGRRISSVAARGHRRKRACRRHVPLDRSGNENVAGSMACAPNAQDVHKLGHKKCGQALRRAAAPTARNAASVIRPTCVSASGCAGGASFDVNCRSPDSPDKSPADQRLERGTPRISTSLPTKNVDNDGARRARSAMRGACDPSRRCELIAAFGIVPRVRCACGHRLTHS